MEKSVVGVKCLSNFFTPLILARGFAAALGRKAKENGAAIINITSIAGHAITLLLGRHIQHQRQPFPP